MARSRAFVVAGSCSEPSCGLYEQEQLCEVDGATLDGFGTYDDWEAVCEDCRHETRVTFEHEPDDDRWGEW